MYVPRIQNVRKFVGYSTLCIFHLASFKKYEWVIHDTIEKKISKFGDPENRFLCKHKHTFNVFFVYLFVMLHQMKFNPQFSFVLWYLYCDTTIYEASMLMGRQIYKNGIYTYVCI